MSSHQRRMHDPAVIATVMVFLAVPSFAQRTSEGSNSAAGLSTVAIGFTTAHGVANSSRSLDVVPLKITDELRPLVDRMWRTSPTFRRQCARLAAESVRVVVQLDLTVPPRVNALTTVDVRNGFVRAVHTRLRRVQPEYLAHEIEHVLEQVDGINLRAAVKNGLTGAWETSSGAFETDRALVIGRLVAQEVGHEIR